MKDETQRPQIWWLPLARRVFGWGAALSLVWGFFISMFLLLPLSALSSWSQTSLGGDWIGWLALRTMNLAPFVPYLCGFILGAASGFFAPPSEPKNPLRSWFARDVAIDTLLFCLLFNFVFILTTTIVFAVRPTEIGGARLSAHRSRIHCAVSFRSVLGNSARPRAPTRRAPIIKRGV